MGYKCQDFCNGQRLDAEHLKAIEDGILAAEGYTATVEKAAKIRTDKLDVQLRIGGVNNNGNFNTNDKTCVIVARPIKLLAGSHISAPDGYSLLVAEYNAPKFGTAYKVNVTRDLSSYTAPNDAYYAIGITDGNTQTDTSIFEKVIFNGFLESTAGAVESDRTHTDAFRSKYLDSYPNMVDYRTRTTKKTIDNKGVVTDSTSYAISDFVLVKPNTNYVTKAVVYIAQYDADKNFIVRIDVSNGVFWTTSSDTCYVRIVSNNDPKLWQLNEGKELAADAAYGAKLKNVDIAHLLLAEDVECMLVKRNLRFYPVPAGLHYTPAPATESGDNYNLFRQFGDTLAVENDKTPEKELDTGKTEGALEKLYKAFTDLKTDSKGYLSIRALGTTQGGVDPVTGIVDPDTGDYIEFPAKTGTDGVYNILEISTNAANYVNSTEARDENGNVIKDDNDKTVWTEVYKNDNIPTILLLVGIHGFEKASIYSTYYFLRDLVNRWSEDPVLEYLRWHINFRIIPVANPWGYVHNSYLNSSDVNLNRAFDWYHNKDGEGINEGGSAPYVGCAEAACIAQWISDYRNAAVLIDFHTTGMEKKDNMVMYHNLLDGHHLAPMKQAALDHINYVHRRYAHDYGFEGSALTGFQYLQTTTPAGQSYGFCQSLGVYGQLVEVGCNLPGENTLYSPKCMEANTRTIGQWLYMAIKAIADVNEHQTK